MFISVLELFKIGIGPSSSHTVGPMIAAATFIRQVKHFIRAHKLNTNLRIRCILKDSLAYTGRGHSSDRAITLGLLHGHTPEKATLNDWRRACHGSQ